MTMRVSAKQDHQMNMCFMSFTRTQEAYNSGARRRFPEVSNNELLMFSDVKLPVTTCSHQRS